MENWNGFFSDNGDGQGGEGREKLVVVHQIRREHRRCDLKGVIRAIRREIVEEHELDPDAILLIRPVSLPLTSSGKVQRSLCRDLAMAGDLPTQSQWVKPQPAGGLLGTSEGPSSVLTGSDTSSGLSADKPCDSLSAGRPDISAVARRDDLAELGQAIQHWLLTWLAQRVEIEQAEGLAATPFAELGVDSMTAVELNQELEEGLQIKNPSRGRLGSSHPRIVVALSGRVVFGEVTTCPILGVVCRVANTAYFMSVALNAPTQ